MTEVRLTTVEVNSGTGVVPYILKKDVLTEGNEIFKVDIKDAQGNLITSAELEIVDLSLNLLSIGNSGMGANNLARVDYYPPGDNTFIEGLLPITEDGIDYSHNFNQMPYMPSVISRNGNASLRVYGYDWLPHLADANGDINIACTTDVAITSSDLGMNLQRIASNGEWFIVQISVTGSPQFAYYVKTGPTTYARKPGNGSLLYTYKSYNALSAVEISPDSTRIAYATSATLQVGLGTCTTNADGFDNLGVSEDIHSTEERWIGKDVKLLWLNNDYVALFSTMSTIGKTRVAIYQVLSNGAKILQNNNLHDGVFFSANEYNADVRPTPGVADSYRFIGVEGDDFIIVDLKITGELTRAVIPKLDDIPYNSAAFTPSAAKVFLVDDNYKSSLYQIP